MPGHPAIQFAVRPTVVKHGNVVDAIMGVMYYYYDLNVYSEDVKL